MILYKASTRRTEQKTPKSKSVLFSLTAQFTAVATQCRLLICVKRQSAHKVEYPEAGWPVSSSLFNLAKYVRASGTQCLQYLVEEKKLLMLWALILWRC